MYGGTVFTVSPMGGINHYEMPARVVHCKVFFAYITSSLFDGFRDPSLYETGEALLLLE